MSVRPTVVVEFVKFSSCSYTGSMREDHCQICRKNSLELTELFCINEVSLV